MTRLGLAWLGAAVVLALGSWAGPAAAKRTGMNLACPNCHEGRDKPQLSVALSAMRVEPGQSVTVTVTAKHEKAKVGGVLVDSHELGAFELIDTVGTRLFEGSPTQATHAMPQAYANGQVQFSFRWVAPATPGAVLLDVWSNAGNDNSKPEDDSAANVLAGVGVGCDAAWYYLDADKDGTGAESSKVLSCTPVAERILQGGDCNDQNAQVHPGAAETCNSVDDDCDGKVDNGFTPVLLVTDADGDGFGATSGMSMIGCPPLAGFAPSFDDCNDSDAAAHPGAMEVANGRDDNCNGKVDDLAAMPSEPGGMMPTTPEPTTPTSTPTAESSCAFNASGPKPPLHGLAGTLLVGWMLLARAARRRARTRA